MLPRAAERDLNDEVQHYFDEAVREGVAAGLSPDDARRAARLDLGSQTSVRERVRESGWENVIGTWSPTFGTPFAVFATRRRLPR